MSSRATTDRLEMLKSKLDKVRPAGKGWVAKCPAHEDRSASLSICVGRNGHVLMNCFAGCNPIHILNAIGLNMEDLYDNKPRRDMTPEEWIEANEAFMRSKWQAALKHLAKEAEFIYLVARALDAGEKLDKESKRRLKDSVNTLREAESTLLRRTHARQHNRNYETGEPWK